MLSGAKTLLDEGLSFFGMVVRFCSIIVELKLNSFPNLIEFHLIRSSVEEKLKFDFSCNNLCN